MAKVKNSCGGTTCIIDPVEVDVPKAADEKVVNVKVIHGYRLFLNGEVYSHPQELALPESAYNQNTDRLELI